MSNNKQKKRTTSLLSGLLIFAIGIILLICNDRITGKGIVVLAGILFLLTGIINLIIDVTQKDEEGKRVNHGISLVFGWLVSIAAMILGLSMLIFTSTFSSLIPFIFGVLIFFGALMLAFTFLVSMRKIVKVPGWLWLFPIAMVICGGITFSQKPDVNDPLIMILTGVSMLLFGLTGVIVGIISSSAKRNAAQVEQATTTDVEAKQISSHN